MYYEVSGSRLRILGTNHVVPEGMPLPSFVLDAVQWAEAGCTEHDPSEFAPRVLLREGERLQDLLPPDVWHALHHAWHLEPRNPADLQRQRPWAAAMNVGISRLRMSPGAEHHFGLHLQKKGRAWGCLERADEVADLLDAVPIIEVAELLRAALPKIDEAQAHFEATYTEWVARDSDGLFEGLKQSPMYSLPSFREAYFLTRNRTWADRLMNFEAPPVNTVLAVGCFHLLGPDNLLDLLRKRGVTIREL